MYSEIGQPIWGDPIEIFATGDPRKTYRWSEKVFINFFFNDLGLKENVHFQNDPTSILVQLFVGRETEKSLYNVFFYSIHTDVRQPLTVRNFLRIY